MSISLKEYRKRIALICQDDAAYLHSMYMKSMEDLLYMPRDSEWRADMEDAVRTIQERAGKAYVNAMGFTAAAITTPDTEE